MPDDPKTDAKKAWGPYAKAVGAVISLLLTSGGTAVVARLQDRDSYNNQRTETRRQQEAVADQAFVTAEMQVDLDVTVLEGSLRIQDLTISRTYYDKLANDATNLVARQTPVDFYAETPAMNDADTYVGAITGWIQESVKDDPSAPQVITAARAPSLARSLAAAVQIASRAELKFSQDARDDLQH